MKVATKLLLFIFIAANLVVPCNVLAEQAKAQKKKFKKEDVLLIGSVSLLILYLITRKNRKPYTIFDHSNMKTWEKYVTNEILEKWYNKEKNTITTTPQRRLYLYNVKQALQKKDQHIMILVESLELHVNKSSNQLTYSPTPPPSNNNLSPAQLAPDNDKEKCPVCYEVLESMPTPDIIQLNCNHMVCKTCISSMRPNNSHYQCPMCRVEITSEIFNKHNIVPEVRALNHEDREAERRRDEAIARRLQQAELLLASLIG